MRRIVSLTPNWNLDRSLFPTDTVRPPANFPIEWGYLSAMLKSFELHCLDEYSKNATPWETSRTIKNIAPEIIVISSTPSYLFWRCPPLSLDLTKQYVGLSRKASPNSYIVVVGPHGTVDPDWALRETQADTIVRGELEGELVNFLEGPRENYGSDGEIGQNVQPGVAKELDFSATKPIDYSHFEGTLAYRPHAWGKAVSQHLTAFAGNRVVLVESSRGCSYRCPYCFRSGFRQRHREKPINQFIVELEQLVKLGIKYVFFIDETFGLNWSHAERTIATLDEAGIRYGIQTRPDILNAERIEFLRKTGCEYVELGIEAMETDLLERLGKFNRSDRVRDVFKSVAETIPYVNRNIVDLTNRDYMDDVCGKTKQLDNEGNLPPPLIPYPTTAFGDKALYKVKTTRIMSRWEVAELLYAFYSLRNKNKCMMWLSDHSSLFRKAIEESIRLLLKARIRVSPRKTRFERLYK